MYTLSHMRRTRSVSLKIQDPETAKLIRFLTENVYDEFSVRMTRGTGDSQSREYHLFMKGKHGKHAVVG